MGRVRRLRLGAWCIVGTATIGILPLLLSTGSNLTSSAAPVGIGLLALACLHAMYTRWRPDPLIGPMLGVVAVVLWAGLAGGVLSLAALRTGSALIDPLLARSDAALGFDTAQVAAWVGAQPRALGWLLKVAYESWLPLLMATVVALVLLGRSDRGWELCFVFAGTITACAVASAFLPAVGVYAHLALPVEVLHKLPPGSGLYHLPTFEAYRTGGRSAIDIWHLEGVVTFPSFHVCLALIQGRALRGIGPISWLNWAWTALVIASTVPIGGHYGVDLIAGALVWGAVALAAEQIGGPERRHGRAEPADGPRVPAAATRIQAALART